MHNPELSQQQFHQLRHRGSSRNPRAESDLVSFKTGLTVISSRRWINKCGRKEQRSLPSPTATACFQFRSWVFFFFRCSTEKSKQARCALKSSQDALRAKQGPARWLIPADDIHDWGETASPLAEQEMRSAVAAVKHLQNQSDVDPS